MCRADLERWYSSTHYGCIHRPGAAVDAPGSITRFLERLARPGLARFDS